MDAAPIQLVENVSTYTVPFTIAGMMRILDCPSVDDCDLSDCIFNCDDGSVTGRGMMTANFFKGSFGDSEGLYVGLITYEFAAQIPEPSTVLLVAAGVPLLWLRRACARWYR
jgi:hypothetical protein